MSRIPITSCGLPSCFPIQSSSFISMQVLNTVPRTDLACTSCAPEYLNSVLHITLCVQISFDIYWKHFARALTDQSQIRTSRWFASSATSSPQILRAHTQHCNLCAHISGCFHGLFASRYIACIFYVSWWIARIQLSFSYHSIHLIDCLNPALFCTSIHPRIRGCTYSHSMLTRARLDLYEASRAKRNCYGWKLG